jgi:hypothetical protein
MDNSMEVRMYLTSQLNTLLTRMQVEVHSPLQIAGSVHARSPSPPLRSLRLRSSSVGQRYEVWKRPDLPRYTSDELSDWQNGIRQGVLHDYSISVKEAARLPTALTHLVRYIAMGGIAKDYVPESSDIDCKINFTDALLSPGIRFEV